MSTMVWIAIGGAAGACCRFVLAEYIFRSLAKPFPYGTLSVNLLGSFAIGVAFVLFSENSSGSHQVRLLVAAGFLGAFTTFSTFSLESVTLLQQARLFDFFIYICTSLIGCLGATATGMWLTKQLV